MTMPERALTLVDETPEEVVHIWCPTCNTRKPMKSVCGIDLEAGDERDGELTLPDCGRCNELWEPHQRAIHDVT